MFWGYVKKIKQECNLSDLIASDMKGRRRHPSLFRIHEMKDGQLVMTEVWAESIVEAVVEYQQSIIKVELLQPEKKYVMGGYCKLGYEESEA